jgi:hypothetical protein
MPVEGDTDVPFVPHLCQDRFADALVDFPSRHAFPVVVIKRPGRWIEILEQARLNRIGDEVKGDLRLLEGRLRLGCELCAGADPGPYNYERAAVLDPPSRSSTYL